MAKTFRTVTDTNENGNMYKQQGQYLHSEATFTKTLHTLAVTFTPQQWQH